jgi:hypothetical protein
VQTYNFKAAFAQPGDNNNDDAHTESIETTTTTTTTSTLWRLVESARCTACERRR